MLHLHRLFLLARHSFSDGGLPLYFRFFLHHLILLHALIGGSCVAVGGGQNPLDTADAFTLDGRRSASALILHHAVGYGIGLLLIPVARLAYGELGLYSGSPLRKKRAASGPVALFIEERRRIVLLGLFVVLVRPAAPRSEYAFHGCYILANISCASCR